MQSKRIKTWQKAIECNSLNDFIQMPSAIMQDRNAQGNSPLEYAITRESWTIARWICLSSGWEINIHTIPNKMKLIAHIEKLSHWTCHLGQLAKAWMDRYYQEISVQANREDVLSPKEAKEILEPAESDDLILLEEAKPEKEHQPCELAHFIKNHTADALNENLGKNILIYVFSQIDAWIYVHFIETTDSAHHKKLMLQLAADIQQIRLVFSTFNLDAKSIMFRAIYLENLQQGYQYAVNHILETTQDTGLVLLFARQHNVVAMYRLAQIYTPQAHTPACLAFCLKFLLAIRNLPPQELADRLCLKDTLITKMEHEAETYIQSIAKTTNTWDKSHYHFALWANTLLNYVDSNNLTISPEDTDEFVALYSQTVEDDAGKMAAYYKNALQKANSQQYSLDHRFLAPPWFVPPNDTNQPSKDIALQPPTARG